MSILRIVVLLAAVSASLMADERLVDVKRVASDKQSAIKDARSIVERARAALDEANKRLAEAERSASEILPAESERGCKEGETGDKEFKRFVLQDDFVLVYLVRYHCSDGSPTYSTSASKWIMYDR